MKPQTAIAWISLALVAFLSLNAAAVETNLEPQVARYIASAGEDEVTAVGVQPSGHIVVAGRIGDVSERFGLDVTQLSIGDTPASTGAILRLSPDGREIISFTRIGELVDDLVVIEGSGRLAITSAQGIAVLNASASEIIWSRGTDFHPNFGRIDRQPSASSGRRIAVGSDGTIAALFNRNVAGNDTHAWVFVFDSNGSQLGEPLTEDRFFYDQRFEDIAVDAANGTVLLAGWRQAHPQLQSPFLVARRYAMSAPDRGEEVWTAFTWWMSAATTQNLRADTRAMRIHRGADGEFYLAGDVHGGDNRFTRAAIFSGAVTSSNPPSQANNTNIDGFSSHAHSQMSGFRGSYLARIDASTGEVKRGQFFHVRTDGPTSQRRTWTTQAIAADEQGQLMFAGSGSFHFPCSPETASSYAGLCQGQNLRFRGQTVGPYFGGEAGIVVMSPDFDYRLRLAKLNPPEAASGSGDARPRVVTRQQGTAVVALHTQRQLATYQAAQSAPQAQSIHLTVWRYADDPSPEPEPERLFQDRFEVLP